jgi:hypothetical protein
VKIAIFMLRNLDNEIETLRHKLSDKTLLWKEYSKNMKLQSQSGIEIESYGYRLQK